MKKPSLFSAKKKKFIAWENQRGFTLLELLIVIAIIVITSTIALVSLSNARVNQDLNRASQTMAANIRLANNYALTGKSGDINQKVCEYRIEFTSTTTYRLVTLTRDALGACGSPQTLADYTVEGGVSAKAAPPFVTFIPPRAETNLSFPLLVKLTKNSKIFVLCVYPSGRVEEHPSGALCT